MSWQEAILTEQSLVPNESDVSIIRGGDCASSLILMEQEHSVEASRHEDNPLYRCPFITYFVVSQHRKGLVGVSAFGTA